MADARSDPDLPETGQHDSTHDALGRFDAYPDHTRPPRTRLLIVAFTTEGEPYDWEPVDTDELSFRELRPGLRLESRRRWLAARAVQAHDRLVARIGPVDLTEHR